MPEDNQIPDQDFQTVAGNRQVERRRVLTMLATAAGLAALPFRTLANISPLVQWQGLAMGAEASLSIVHPDRSEAEAIIEDAVRELRRLEKLFSLFDPSSSIRELNAIGRLDAAPRDFRDLLNTALSISHASGGAFDPTVQPLWELYDAHFNDTTSSPATGSGPDAAAVRKALNATGYKSVVVDSSSIAFAKAGMALTFNGIAQGYITDRIAMVLKSAGLQNVLVDMGEFRGLGNQAGGEPWRIGLGSNFRPGGDTVTLTDRAIATSEPIGTVFEKTGKFHHLFSPSTGRPASFYRRLSVIAPTATLADALSTGLAVADADARAEIVANFDGSGMEVHGVTMDGSPLKLTL